MPDEPKACDGCRWEICPSYDAPCGVCVRRSIEEDYYEPVAPVEGEKEKEDDLHKV